MFSENGKFSRIFQFQDSKILVNQREMSLNRSRFTWVGDSVLKCLAIAKHFIEGIYVILEDKFPRLNKIFQFTRRKLIELKLKDRLQVVEIHNLIT